MSDQAAGDAPMSEDALLWRLKQRLQWSGWLQFSPNGVLVLLVLLLAWLGSLVSSGLAWGLVLIGGALFVNLLVDIVTVKYRLHPTEKIPPARDALDVFDVMRARRACRSFQKGKLTAAHKEFLLETAEQYARPENQIGTAPIRFEYVEAPLTVWPVIGAHQFFVAIAPKVYDPMAVIDVGRSLQKVVIAATRMGLATCWIGPGADHESVIAHLGDRFNPDRDHIICVCAVGYQSRYKPLTLRLIQRVQHKRLPLSDLFFTSPMFDKPLDVTAAPFNAFGRCYEVCQWSPSSFNGQPTRGVARTHDDGSFAGLDFYAAIDSRFYAMVALGIWCANWEMGAAALGHAGSFVRLPALERDGLPSYQVSWQPA